MVKEILRIGRKLLKKYPRINLSISSFIPKPHTPFQWLRMEEKDILHAKFNYVLSHLKKYPTVKLKRDPLERSVLEGVFSRGDRRLNAVLLRAWKSGARFESWNDMLRFPIWEKAFESENIDFQEYLSELDRRSILPWDHIDTGLEKNHLLEELQMALDGKSSLSCLDKDCSVCHGCSLSKFYTKKFNASIAGIVDDSRPLGKRSENVQRYRASFRKKNHARFLSHMNLNNIIRQGFRRAGISVCYSQGFHPKMLISYLPALPLGMAAHAEWIEFKSGYVFSEDEFVPQINRYMLEGIEFFGLSRLDETELPMNRRIRAFVYSIDLRNKKVIEAIKNLSLSDKADENYFDQAKKLVEIYLKRSTGESLERVFVDETAGKLMLFIKNVPLKGEKPQDIMSVLLGLDNPVFMMAREKVLLENKDLTRHQD